MLPMSRRTGHAEAAACPVYLALFCDPHSADGKIHVRIQFVGVLQPSTVDTAGLIDCFERAMDHAGIADWRTKLIGVGCYGAAVNVAKNGLKGKLTTIVPWVVVVRCVAHRLELALKDALSTTLFADVVDAMLMSSTLC